MDKLEIVKCKCGDDSCQTYQLNNIGYFAQGSGFDIVEAQLIADAVNNTANKGIDPNAVPGLLEALKEAKDLLHTLRVESLYRAHNQRKKQMDKIEQAIKSADLK